MQDFQLLEIVLFGLLAGFMAFRLYTVLGRRTGHERTRDDRLDLPNGAQPNPKAPPSSKAPPVKDNVIPLERPGVSGAGATGPLARALMDIKLNDRNFDSEKFLGGARGAYEMVVTAFARGDRDTLQGLLSEEVFDTFDKVITARETKKERVDFTFLALKAARITDAEMKGRMAEVTVTFESEVMTAAYDSNGALIDGDAKVPRQVTDIWTFARDTHSSDPNWLLTATASGA